MPPPEYYDDWDPEAHDLETERLREISVKHWQSDLRRLQTDVEAEQEDARRAARPARFDFGAIRQVFEDANPKPDRLDFEACAEWEWRLDEHIYEVTGNDLFLHRHRMERRSYIERYTAMNRRSQERFDETFGRLKDLPRDPGGWQPIPWPVGDGVSGWRDRFDVEERYLVEAGELDDPAFDASIDLDAGMLGWFQSLYKEEREPSAPFRKAVKEAGRLARRAYEPEYLPGHVGDALTHLRRAVQLCQDALDLLDGYIGEPWMTATAYHRLRELVEALLNATADRYAEIRALHAAYRQRAVHFLQPKGTEGGPAAFDAHPLLPERYDHFDLDAYKEEGERLDAVDYEHSQNDLRSLLSEVEAERRESARKARPPKHDDHGIRAAFEADHPPPPESEPDARAEWEWRWLEHYYEATGAALLHPHRMERGAYIARYAARLWDRKNHLDESRRILDSRTGPPSPPPEYPPWPDGDGVTQFRDYDEDHIWEGQDHALEEPSFDRALDLLAAAGGWTVSLPTDQAYEIAEPAINALNDAAHEICRSYLDEYRPATIGESQLHMRRGLLRLDDALALLDGLRGYDWLSDAADARLRELIEAAREAATERYTELRALYDAYRERAIRILGPEGVAGL